MTMTQPMARPTAGAWPSPPHGDAIGSRAPGDPDNRVIPAISARGLTRVYDVPGRKDAQVVALDGVDVDLPAGSFTAVVGASGSGKSTLLHILAGLDAPTGGQVSLLGTTITSMTPAKRAAFRSRNVGFVFQDYNLIASLTAAENVSMPSSLAGRPLGKGQAVAALEAVGLAERADLKPHQLSGGERQRVAIARVMASRPRIVFADEPTGALDLNAGQVVLDWLRRLAEQGATVAMVTHDVEAAARADAVAVMSGGRLIAWSDSHDAARIAELVHSARTPARAPGHAPAPASQAPVPAGDAH